MGADSDITYFCNIKAHIVYLSKKNLESVHDATEKDGCAQCNHSRYYNRKNR